MNNHEPKPLRLAARSAHQFSRRSIERANIYVEHGLVEIREGSEPDATRIFAVVRGSRARPYVVALDLAEIEENASLACACTCPYADAGSLCKHVFAVLLVLDRRDNPGAPPAPATGRSLTVDPLVLVAFDSDELAAKDADWFGPRESSAGTVDLQSPSDDLVPRSKPPPPRPRGASRRDLPEWQVRLFAVRRAASALPSPVGSPLGAEALPRLVHYAIDVDLGLERGGLVVGLYEERSVPGEAPPRGVREVLTKEPRPAERRRLRPIAIGPDELERFADADDRRALALLTSTPLDGGARPSIHGHRRRSVHECLVPPGLYPYVLPALQATGRLECQGRAVAIDDGEPWRFSVVLRPAPADGPGDERDWSLSGRLYRRRGPDLGEHGRADAGRVETAELDEPLLLLADGLVLFPDRLARLEARHDFPWIVLLRSTQLIRFPARSLGEVLVELAGMFELPRVELEAGPGPTGVPWRTTNEAPRPVLSFLRPLPESGPAQARLSFRYANATFPLGAPSSGALDSERHVLAVRDREGEHALVERLAGLGGRRHPGSEPDLLDLPLEGLPELVRALEREGWLIFG